MIALISKIILGFLLQITDDGIGELTERCPRLYHVCISLCSDLTDLTLINLAQRSPLLSELEWVLCTNFTDMGFQALARVS